MKRKLITSILLGTIMLTGCGKNASEVSSESSTAVETEDTKDDSEKEDASEVESTEDGTYVVFTRGDESYPYHLYTDSNDYSKYDYRLEINGTEKSSYVTASHGEVTIDNLENGREVTIPAGDIRIDHYDFEAAKDKIVYEDYTFATYLEYAESHIDMDLDKYNSEARRIRDDLDNKYIDQDMLIYNNSNYEDVSLYFWNTDELSRYDKSPMSTECVLEYSTEEYEVDGYPVMIHTYTYETNASFLHSDNPTWSEYVATVKLSDDVFIQVYTNSALSSDEAKALVQKYVFDAMDL